MLEQLDNSDQKSIWTLYLVQKSNRITDKSKCKAIKPLEENIGENLWDPELSAKFLDMTQKAPFIKENSWYIWFH